MLPYYCTDIVTHSVFYVITVSNLFLDSLFSWKSHDEEEVPVHHFLSPFLCSSLNSNRDIRVHECVSAGTVSILRRIMQQHIALGTYIAIVQLGRGPGTAATNVDSPQSVHDVYPQRQR